MQFTDLYEGIGDFRQYVEGLQPDTMYEQLAPAISTAGIEVIKVITADAFIDIINGAADEEAAAAAAQEAAEQQPANDEPQQSGDDPQEPAEETTEETTEETAGEESSQEETEGQPFTKALEFLKRAVATRAMYSYQIFNSVKKNGSDAALYKYQHEELKDFYIEAHWKAMDSLLEWLDAHADGTSWGSSREYEERQKLPVKDADEFNYYYGIDRSSYFYQKVLYLLRSCWQKIQQKIRSHEEDESIMDHAKRSLCYTVMARAVMQFDVTELPRSIRWDYNHEYTRGSNPQSRERLYMELAGLANAEMDTVQNIIRMSVSGPLEENKNEEKNKFYLSI